MNPYCDRSSLDLITQQCALLRAPTTLSAKILRRRLNHRKRLCENVVKENLRIYTSLKRIARSPSQSLRLVGAPIVKKADDHEKRIKLLLDLLKEDQQQHHSFQTPENGRWQRRVSSSRGSIIDTQELLSTQDTTTLMSSYGSALEDEWLSLPRVDFLKQQQEQEELMEEPIEMLDYRHSCCNSALEKPSPAAAQSSFLLAGWGKSGSAPQSTISSSRGTTEIDDKEIWLRIQKRIARLRDHCSTKADVYMRGGGSSSSLLSSSGWVTEESHCNTPTI